LLGFADDLAPLISTAKTGATLFGAIGSAVHLTMTRRRRPIDETGQGHHRDARRISARRGFTGRSICSANCVKTLKRTYLLDDIPYPKVPRRLPTILTVEEVTRLIDAARTLSDRTMLMVLYSTGMRNAEMRSLQVKDIDSRSMLIHIQRGKGGRDRYVPLSATLLETLRVYWRWMKPKMWLFPGTIAGWRADKPITPKVVWDACQSAAARAKIQKRVSAHLLRHSYATLLLEAGADLRTIQLLLGHVKLEHTVIYLHLSRRHLHAVANPLDAMPVSAPDTARRSRRLQKR
jgi:integrase/recombinase XerD